MDFKVVDAFTSTAFGGNPAAIIVLSGDAFPKDELLAKIAAEFNLSETAFLLPDRRDKADDGSPLFHLRWFTPKVEVVLCGHATLASAHVLFSTLANPLPSRIRFKTLSGILVAKLHDAESKSISLDFPAPPVEVCEDKFVRKQVELATGLSKEKFLYWGAQKQYYVVEVEPDVDLEKLDVDFSALAKITDRNVILASTPHSRHLSTMPSLDFVSRVFCAASGIDEDPVTGSAHCALAVHYGRKLNRFVGSAKPTMEAKQVSRRGEIRNGHWNVNSTFLTAMNIDFRHSIWLIITKAATQKLLAGIKKALTSPEAIIYTLSRPFATLKSRQHAMALKQVTLNTGAVTDAIGLGTWKSEPDKVREAVKIAIEAGYRHIDCAAVYENEPEVGEGIAEGLASTGLPRERIFVTSKLWNTMHRPEDVPKALDKTLKDLKLTYLDLYLMHWPLAFKNRGDGNSEKDKEGNMVFDQKVTIEDTWKAMERLMDEGKVKAIGVSNFTISKLKKLLASARIPPAALQVELHPYLPQFELVEFCKKNNIMVTGYSPLGTGGEPKLLEDPVIVEIAKKHSKDPGQVVISWAIQRGTHVIPKSSNPDRIKSNFDVFKLSDEEMEKINGIHKKTSKRFVSSMDAWKVEVFDE
ncbi:hypothetical protein HK101_005573 [Irineochytrium annulatum]|nr:hypothetical protein HK101_005573 [Irineochytrium annulatum]